MHPQHQSPVYLLLFMSAYIGFLFWNREKGIRVLRSRLYEQEMDKQNAELAQARKSQVGTGDRSEKIRTYNFPQNRLTDHRIGLTLHQLDLVMEGRLQPIVDALITHYQAEQLRADTH